VPKNLALSAGGEISPEWMDAFREFPDRFVIGGDQFFASPRLQGPGPGLVFAQRAPVIRRRTIDFLHRLPPDLAPKMAHENAVRLYKLKE